MKNDFIAFWILLMTFLLILSVGFAGCLSQSSSASPATPTDPNAFRTAKPTTPTLPPTPTAKISPKFSKGDIVAYEPVTIETKSLYIILDYDSKNDGYDVTFIHRNDDGSWGHWTFTSTDHYFARDSFEKNYGKPDTWIYGHIDPDQVHCEAPKTEQDPDFAKWFPCTRNVAQKTTEPVMTPIPSPIPNTQHEITDGFWCRDTTINIGTAPTGVKECYKFLSDGTYKWGYSPGWPMGKSLSCSGDPNAKCVYSLNSNGKYEVQGGYFYTLSGNTLIDSHDPPYFKWSSTGIP